MGCIYGLLQTGTKGLGSLSSEPIQETLGGEEITRLMLQGKRVLRMDYDAGLFAVPLRCIDHTLFRLCVRLARHRPLRLLSQEVKPV
jgi:hypothetical protein